MTPTQNPRPLHLRRLVVALAATAFLAAGVGVTAVPAQRTRRPHRPPTTVSAARAADVADQRRGLEPGDRRQHRLRHRKLHQGASAGRAGRRCGRGARQQHLRLRPHAPVTASRPSTTASTRRAWWSAPPRTGRGSTSAATSPTVDGHARPCGRVRHRRQRPRQHVGAQRRRPGSWLRRHGSTVYVGGNFPSANGSRASSSPPSLSPTAAMQPWTPDRRGQRCYVWTMAMSPGQVTCHRRRLVHHPQRRTRLRDGCARRQHRRNAALGGAGADPRRRPQRRDHQPQDRRHPDLRLRLRVRLRSDLRGHLRRGPEHRRDQLGQRLSR